MCGIAGLIDFNEREIPASTLKKMTDAIAHRGPDGEGQWIEDSIGLGHRRLAIIDLSPMGAQPMVSHDGQHIITYNGEIYNYRDLRKTLESEGFSFQSQSDTEVILHALAAWGTDGLNKLNGMFALAIWDRKNKKLTLARDRYGIKPLYYTQQNSFFAFGSEQKAIFAIPGFTRVLDRAVLFEYFTFQNIFTDRTLTKGIHILPAGHYATLDLQEKNPKLVTTEYWDYNFQDPKIQSDDREHKEELDRLFTQSVQRQLISDVELGCYLSGGIDSGSITAVAAKSSSYLKTFTCGFDLNSASGLELAFDERRTAEYMSYLFKTEHYEVVLKAGDMERCLPKISRHLEEPRIGQSYPNYYIAGLASKFVKVVLSGTGGDELFGGYPWRYYRTVVNKNFNHYIDKYYHFWQRLVEDHELKELFGPIWNDVKDVSTKNIFTNVFKNNRENISTPEDYLNHSLYFEAKTFLHGLLVVEDKLSMAHGLESRVPFLDNDLVDFAMRCPAHLKLNNLTKVVRLNENLPGDKTKHYFKKTNDGKQILRDVMKKYIPDAIAKAEKQGFSAPDASWFSGDSINFVRNKLLHRDAKIYEFMDRKTVERLLEEHMSGRKNRRLLIWSLLNVEELIEQFYS